MIRGWMLPVVTVLILTVAWVGERVCDGAAPPATGTPAVRKPAAAAEKKPVGPKESPATQPAATQPARPKLPPEVIQKIEAEISILIKKRRVLSLPEKVRRLGTILKLGERAEKDHPTAIDLCDVRQHMLSAAQALAQITRDKTYIEKIIQIASRLAASDAPPENRVIGDFHLIRLSNGAKGNPAPAEETRKQVRALVKRYDKTKAAGTSVMYAIALANQFDLEKLGETLVNLLETKYADTEGARRLLRRMGRSPDVGKPFIATLTKLDGKKLSLPDDLKGKVLVIDFWATWCGPCIVEIPHMKEVYAQYKDQGVEFVGISLDFADKVDREDLKKFVEAREMSWVHTYTGMGFGDPTARRYGVHGIPALWVIGKDGKVISDTARGRLEEIIEKALKASATKDKDPKSKDPTGKKDTDDKNAEEKRVKKE